MDVAADGSECEYLYNHNERMESELTSSGRLNDLIFGRFCITQKLAEVGQLIA